MSTDVTWAGASICPSCKRTVKHKPQGGPHRWHGCRVRWIKRRAARSYLEGWVDGYKFANGDDEPPALEAS